MSLAKYLLLCLFIYAIDQNQTSIKLHVDGLTKIPKNELSRRDAVIVGTSAVVYGKIIGDAVKKLTTDEKPALHENMVKETFALAFETAARNPIIVNGSMKNPLRVLELGIGENLQTLQRGLYDLAFEKLSRIEQQDDCVYNGIEFCGTDIINPHSAVLVQATEKFESSTSSLSPSSFEFIQGGAEKLDFPDGYFDVVTCCLVLCSVNDQRAILNEIKRVLKSNGAFGWVEHVAVQQDLDNNHRVLEVQQKLFDPLQQAVAHNCHLHRYTDDNILDIFSSTRSDGKVDRFFVEDMWPVSCQVRGVVHNLG